MGTVATPVLRQFAKDWESKCNLTSAVCSGIVGDLAHRLRGGFHISREDQPKDNFSVVRPDDRPGNGPNDAAAAVDMTMSTSDMKKCTARLVSAYNNMSDPRRKYINAFNGTLDGVTAKRWDVYAHTSMRATVDHLWHVHLEIRRKYVNSATAMKAILSILKGETVAVYLKSIGGVITPVKPVVLKAPVFPGRTLARNDKQAKPDPAVKAWQARMIARGWTSLGRADGYFGARLETVVKAWQRSKGLGVDGKIGPKTWPTPWTVPFVPKR